MPDFKFIIVPRDHHTNEVIAEALAQVCAIGSDTEVIFHVGTVEKRGYYVEHQFITKIKNFKDPRIKVELYKQQGTGPIKPYDIPQRKPAKKVREAKKRVKEIISKR